VPASLQFVLEILGLGDIGSYEYDSKLLRLRFFHSVILAAGRKKLTILVIMWTSRN